LLCPQISIELWDIFSDCFMTYSVLQWQHKEWVRPLVTPFVVVLCVASATSLSTLLLKGRLLITKLCKRRVEMTEWHADVAYDTKTRREWIDKVTGHDQSHSTMENQAIASGMAVIDMFSAGLSAAAKSQGHFKLDAPTNRLIGYAEGLVRGASPEEVVAYLMDIESKFVQGSQNRNVTVRFEVVGAVNDHHKIVFTETKTLPFSNRTFLTSLICKKISDDPPTWGWVTVSIPGHARMRPEDEQHAVRGEVMRCVRLTAVSGKETRVEYACWLDLKGSFPKWLTHNIAMPEQVPCP